MMKLPQPKFTFASSIDACIEGITGNIGLRGRVTNGKAALLATEAHYLAAANGPGLHSVAAVVEPPHDPHVVGGLSKSDLVKLYDQYFVPEGKPGRNIYDDLFNAAREECPFCGGIGVPKTLDHYLPKAKHPSFGVLPINLVPCCRDCNMGEKGQAVARTADELFLQPYTDAARFFDEQWVFARYVKNGNGGLGRIQYFVNAPILWSDQDRARASNHFDSFDLARQYGTKAAQMLGTVLEQVKRLANIGLAPGLIKTTLLDPGIANAPFVNHWHRGLYQAVSDSIMRDDA